MSGNTARLLRRYAVLIKPEGTTKYLDGRTVRYDGRIQFYRALKRDYKRGVFKLSEIKKELKQAGVLNA